MPIWILAIAAGVVDVPLFVYIITHIASASAIVALGAIVGWTLLVFHEGL